MYISRKLKNISNNEFLILFILFVISFLIYLPSVFSGITLLDDYNFIYENDKYFKDLPNLIRAFFVPFLQVKTTPFYRPIFADTLQLNFLIGCHTFWTYHIINSFLHGIAVLLLNQLFRKINIIGSYSFVLCLLFAVHPVLVQAVSWIPGRNDTLLAVFIFSFLIQSFSFLNNGSIRSYIFSLLFLLLALFTKETAVVAPIISWILCSLYLGKKWNDKRLFIQYATWCLAIFFYLYLQQIVVPHPEIRNIKSLLFAMNHRFPIMIQYIGKIVFPINLSVYATSNESTHIYGIIALVIFLILIIILKKKDFKKIVGAISIFIFFLLPVLAAPDAKNNNFVFEHRVYLSFIGFLLLINEVIFKNIEFNKNQIFIVFGFFIMLITAINLQHQFAFSSPKSFWTNAVYTNPHNAVANMMMAIVSHDVAIKEKYFNRAFQINPKTKSLNLYYAVFLQNIASFQDSKKYLEQELKITDAPNCYFYLARSALNDADTMLAIKELKFFLKNSPNYNWKKLPENIIENYSNVYDSNDIYIYQIQNMDYPIPRVILNKVGL